MAPTQLLFLSIFLSVLAGADAVSTVSTVAVQSGGSVTIPCHYDKKYENNVKFWCQGSNWNICHTAVRTDSPTVESETSITDDPTHHVFTVTIKNLTLQVTGYYWCGIEIKGVGDDYWFKHLHLSVTAGTPGLWVDQQEMTGAEGGHASVQCHYNEPSSTKKWCRAEDSCVEVNSAKSGRAEIKDDRSENVFIVTMRELNREDTGWYWCATGELQIPVHITVTQKPTTTTVTTSADSVSTVSKVAVQSGRSVTIPCHYDKKYEKHVKYWCRGSDWRTCRTLVRTDFPKVEDPGIWVDHQEVTGVEGGYVSVQCHTNYRSSMKKWCRAEGACVEVNSAKSGRSEIKDDRSEKVFIVTMRELNREDAGWYWCAAGELQIPVHITVFQKTTNPTVTTYTITSLSRPQENNKPTSTTDGAPTSLERTLGPLRHTGVALVFLICSAVAFWKIWRYRRAQHSRKNREGVGRYANNTAEPCNLLTMDVM